MMPSEDREGFVEESGGRRVRRESRKTTTSFDIDEALDTRKKGKESVVRVCEKK